MAGRALHTNLSQVTMRVGLFGNIVGWFLTDIRRNAKRLFVLIFALSVLGVFARLGAIGSFMTYIHAQQTDQPIIVRGVELPSDTGLGTLLLWGSAALGLAITTGIATYLADVATFRMAREAMRRVVDRAMTVVAAGQTRPLPVADDMTVTAASRKALIGDAMMFMRAMLVFGRVAVPLVTLCLATGFLFKYNAQLTLILAPALIIYVVPFYRFNRTIAKASRAYEQRRQRRAGVLGRLMTFASQTQYPGITRPAWADLYQSEPKGQSAMDAFRWIILSRRRVSALQDVFFGVVLFALLIVFGKFRASDGVDWFDLLVYLIALRYAIQGMGQTASAVITITRFAPQIRRLKEFASLDVEAAAVGIDEDAKLWTFHAARPGLEGSAPSAKPQLGDVVACIDACPTDSYRLVEFCRRLLGTTNRRKCNRLLGAMFYCGDVRRLPGLPIVQLLTGEKEPDATAVDGAKRVLDRFGVLNEIEVLPSGMETTLGPESTEGLSPLCLYALCLVPGVRSSRQYFVLDWKPLARMGSEARQAVLELLSDRIVMLVSTGAPADLLSQSSLVVVLDESTISGIGDAQWYGALEDASQRQLQLVGASNGLDEEEDVDDLEEL